MQAPSFFRACLLHALYDIKRSLYGPKVLLIGISFALIWGVILRYVIVNAATFVDQQMNFEGGNFILQAMGFEGLMLWPATQLAAFWLFALKVLPLLCITLSADILINDRVNKRLRFWQLRSHRFSLLFGRMLAKGAVIGVLVLLALISCLVVIAQQQPDKLADSVSAAGIMFICLLISSLPFISLMALVASISQTPWRASLLALLIWGISSLLLGALVYRFPALSVLEWMLPGSQLDVLKKLAGVECFTALWPALLQSIVFVMIALGLWRRADI